MLHFEEKRRALLTSNQYKPDMKCIYVRFPLDYTIIKSSPIFHFNAFHYVRVWFVIRHTS